MQQHYTNTTEQPQYVGGKLIPPGETRLVDMPTIVAAPAPAATAEDRMVVLAKSKVSDIVAALPDLATADIDQLLAHENAQPKPRTTLVQALELRKLEIIDLGKNSGGDGTGEAATSEDDPPASDDASDASTAPQD